MKLPDESFLPSENLDRAIHLLRTCQGNPQRLPSSLPELGMGEFDALEKLAPSVIGGAADLGASSSLAHMDPPTPWVTWAASLWNASRNQNLLHEATSPFATEAERLVLGWLLPFFSMEEGHFCSGSTLANLTALWAARDSRGIRRVAASESSHVSIKKSANILGLEYEALPVDKSGKIAKLPDGGLDSVCLVLTAGTTATGSIDPLDLVNKAGWTHVDAAWAGPLRLSSVHSALLGGIEQADSIAVSAHKWLFQPKESAMVMFKHGTEANNAISFGGGYLARPNIGVQGSRGAAAIPLLATLLAWGRLGIAERIEYCVSLAEKLASKLEASQQFELWGKPQAGVTVFRPVQMSVDDLANKMPDGMLSTCTVDGQRWLRSVAANPNANVEQIHVKLESCALMRA